MNAILPLPEDEDPDGLHPAELPADEDDVPPPVDPL